MRLALGYVVFFAFRWPLLPTIPHPKISLSYALVDTKAGVSSPIYLTQLP